MNAPSRRHDKIAEIQRDYVALLRSHCGSLAHDFDAAMGTANRAPINDPLALQRFVAGYLLNHAQPSEPSSLYLPPRLQKKRRSRAVAQVNDLLLALQDFWDSRYPDLKQAITDSDRLYTLIGDLDGDTSYYAECIIRLGLYFDAVCIVDPLSLLAERLRSGDVTLDALEADPVHLLSFYRNYLHLLQITPALTSDTGIPVAIVVPAQLVRWSGDAFESIRNLAEATACTVFSESLGRDISCFRELLEISQTLRRDTMCAALETNHVITNLLRNHGVATISKLQEAHRTFHPAISDMLRNVPAPVDVLYPLFGYLQGTFLALDGAEAVAHDYKVSFTQPKTHWSLNRYRLERHIHFTHANVPENMVARCAVMSERCDFLLAATMNDLIELRRGGILEAVRSLYRTNARSLQRSSLDDLEALTQELIATMRDEIESSVMKLKRAEIATRTATSAATVGLVANSAFGIMSNVLAQPVGWLLMVASALIETESVPAFLSRQMLRRGGSGDHSRSPALFMHDLMNRARMEQALSGTMSVKLNYT